jgi:GMP synthase (glutamine-hydrolysing)
MSLEPIGVYESEAYPFLREELEFLRKRLAALQFQPEASARGLERWYVGHCGELGRAGIKVPQLRQESATCAPRLKKVAAGLWKAWLESLSFG